MEVNYEYALPSLYILKVKLIHPLSLPFAFPFNAGITLIAGHKFFAVTRATVQVTDLVQATG